MQTKFLGALFAAALLAAPTTAQEKPNDKLTFTANVTAVSDYSFRGISQTDNNPALQGSIEAAITMNSFLTGYMSAWGSNVKFEPPPDTGNDKANAEIDYTIGFRGTVDSFGWDLKFIYYAYPGATSSLNYDYTEFAAAVNYDFGFVIPTIGVNRATTFYGNSGKATYVYGGVKVPIPFTEFSPRILANVGRQKIENNTAFGVPDYTDWNIGLFATFFGALDVGIQYVDTNVKGGSCYNRTLDDLCDGRVIGSVGYTLTF